VSEQVANLLLKKKNRLPHPLSGSFSEVNLLLLGPAHVTNLLQKKAAALQVAAAAVAVQLRQQPQLLCRAATVMGSRQAAQNGSSSFSAKAVARRFCAELKRQLLREWDLLSKESCGVGVRTGC
jgi:hypothetical protein